MARLDRSLDRSVRDRLQLPRGERPLAWAHADKPGTPMPADGAPADGAPADGDRKSADADTVPGDVWVGTRAALYIPAEGTTYRRIPWVGIDRADWNDTTQDLRVVELAAFGDVMPRSIGRLRAADRLLQLVRERVTATVVAVRTVPLRDGRGVRVVARRDPDGHGDLTWTAVLDPGLDPADPAVVDGAQQALAGVRAEVGLDA